MFQSSGLGEKLADLNSMAISVVTLVGFGIAGFFALVGLWQLIKVFNKSIVFKIRYGMLKRKIPDSLVEKCIYAIDDGKTAGEFAKEVIIKGSYSVKNIKELIYVYNQIEKNVQEVDKNE